MHCARLISSDFSVVGIDIDACSMVEVFGTDHIHSVLVNRSRICPGSTLTTGCDLQALRSRIGADQCDRPVLVHECTWIQPPLPICHGVSPDIPLNMYPRMNDDLNRSECSAACSGFCPRLCYEANAMQRDTRGFCDCRGWSDGATCPHSDVLKSAGLLRSGTASLRLRYFVFGQDSMLLLACLVVGFLGIR